MLLIYACAATAAVAVLLTHAHAWLGVLQASKPQPLCMVQPAAQALHAAQQLYMVLLKQGLVD
jgi:hypothetical protein